MIPQPVLLVAGSDTVAPFRAMVDRLSLMLANVEEVLVPEAGHLMPLTHPARVAEVIAGFAGRLASPQEAGTRT